MKIDLLKELSKGAKPYSPDHRFAPMLEEMFWEGLVEFKGNVVSITPLGLERLKEM